MTDELESGVFLGHVACPKHGGSDSLALHEKEKEVDGYCWSECGLISARELKELGVTDGAKEVLVEYATKSNRGRKGKGVEVTEDLKKELERVKSESKLIGWRERKIKTSTCQKYGVYTKTTSGGRVHFRYYPSTYNGELVGYHVRNDIVKQKRKKDKSVKGYPFFPIGNVGVECDLFGMSLFAKGGRFVVLTEGEEDCQAVYQVLLSDTYETPVVSPTVGARGAVRQISSRQNYEFLKSFDKIVVMGDQDKAGKEFSEEVSKLFGRDKVIVADIPADDPCDLLLKENGAKLLKNAFWQAVPKKPSQVLTVDDIFDRALQSPKMGLSLPWPTATISTLGLRKGEIHIVGAAPKIGKTEFQHQLVKHHTDVHGGRVGIMSLEENPVKTLRKIAGKYAGKQFTKPPEVAGYTQKELAAAMEMVRNKVEFYSSEGVRDHEEILETIRYWHSQGIWLFVIDPLTALVAEYSSSEANDVLNKFMSQSASMCMELDITMFMFSHVNPVKSGLPHDQGGDVLSSQFTGSRAMEKWAHYGWGIQRNRMSPDPVTRNTARVTMLFDREYGEHCEFYTYYDAEKNDWSEVDPTQISVFSDEELFGGDDEVTVDEEDVTIDDLVPDYDQDDWEIIDV